MKSAKLFAIISTLILTSAIGAEAKEQAISSSSINYTNDYSQIRGSQSPQGLCPILWKCR